MNNKIDDILFDGLYNKTNLEDYALKDLKDLHSIINRPSKMNDREHFDLYCIECNKVSVFKKVGVDYTQEGSYFGTGYVKPRKSAHEKKKELLEDNFFELEVKCARNEHHRNKYFYVIKEKEIQKIGQYPSIADTEIQNFRKFNKILDSEHLNELNRSIGLASHGIGIGSFIYLRRIIEFIIGEAYSKASNKDGWDDEIYQRSRILEKIKLLEGFLPDILIKNSSSYSILSKGIHELSEDECLNYFPTLRDLVYLILQEKYSKREEEAIKQSISSNLSKIRSNLN